MLSPMPEKEDKAKASKKTAPKKTAGKTQSKTRSRAGTTAKKKPRSSAARKKQLRRNSIAALGILCVLLLALNLVLVLKLIPNLKKSLQPDDSTAQTQVEQKAPLTEQKQNESITAEKKAASAVSAPQVAAQAPKSQPQHTEHTVAKSEPAKNEQPKQEPVQSKKWKTEAAHTPAVQKTTQKEKPAVRTAPQKKPIPEKPTAPDKKPAELDKRISSQSAQPVQPAAKPEKPRQHAPYAGNLTFVFDDAGHNLEQLEHFLQLPFPCTIAVLPGLRYSSESARRIRKAGKQVILHQPMQSVDLHINPGPGAVTPGLSAEQIKNIVRKNLEEIWPVAGMNNHEGSLMTADEAAMRAVLDVVAEKHIFFLDSRTTSKSVVPKVAKEKNMAVWERAIFIDNDKSRAAMEAQIKKGLSIARQKGSAIMIGHVFTVELAQLLTEMYPALIEEGFSLSAIAQAAQTGTVNFDD